MSTTQAVINVYGIEQLTKVFNTVQTEREAFMVYKALIRRDAPHLYNHFMHSWGGFKKSFNGLIKQLNIVYSKN